MRKLLSKIYHRVFTSDKYKFFIKDWISLFDLSASLEVLNTKRFTQNLKPIVLNEMKASKVLIVSPHPDDDAFGCAGTLLKFKDDITCSTVYVTDAGDTQEDIDKLKTEAKAVSKALQSEPIFLGYEPGAIPVECETLLKTIKDFRPDIIFITFMLDDHDDHRRVNHLLSNTIKQANYKGEVWSYQIYSTVLPNVVVNITKTIKEKYRVMELYKTIYGNRDWPHYVKGINASNCRYLSGKENKYAETFFVVPAIEYMELTNLYFSKPCSALYYKSYRN